MDSESRLYFRASSAAFVNFCKHSRKENYKFPLNGAQVSTNSSLIRNSIQNSIRGDQQLRLEECGQRDLASTRSIKIIPAAAASRHDKFGLAANGELKDIEQKMV